LCNEYPRLYRGF